MDVVQHFSLSLKASMIRRTDVIIFLKYPQFLSEAFLWRATPKNKWKRVVMKKTSTTVCFMLKDHVKMQICNMCEFFEVELGVNVRAC